MSFRQKKLQIMNKTIQWRILLFLFFLVIKSTTCEYAHVTTDKWTDDYDRVIKCLNLCLEN